MRISSRLRAKWAPQETPPAPDPSAAPPADAESAPPEPEYKWLRMRIGEEKDRREREARILERLPDAAAELNESLADCLDAYNSAFGPGSAELQSEPLQLRILARHIREGQPETARIEILSVPAIPGFQIDRNGSPLVVEIGILPDGKLFYRDRDQDQYLTMEELTRRILDRTLFPKLGE